MEEQKKSSALKGRTYEEIYGKEKAEQLKKDRSVKLKGNQNLKGFQANAKGSKWFTNGTNDRMIHPNQEVPLGWFPGRSKNRKGTIELVPIEFI